MEKTIASIAGRILLALIFLMAGINKIPGYTDTEAYMSAFGIPGILLPVVIILEIGGAIALIIGWQTRWAAYALAAFTLLAALIFHTEFSEQVQMILFLKNIAIVGGLLVLAVNGAGPCSLDDRKKA